MISALRLAPMRALCSAPSAGRRRFSSLDIFPDEPAQPSVHTAMVPGPKSKQISSRIDHIQDPRTHVMVVDYDASNGNFIIDADSNTLLDVFAQISSIALGYNPPPLLDLARSDEFVRAAINRPALGSFPPVKWAEWLEGGMLTVKPKGLEHLVTTLCGSSANETAFKAACMAYRARERGPGVDFTKEEMVGHIKCAQGLAKLLNSSLAREVIPRLRITYVVLAGIDGIPPADSCMENKAPGSPELSILSFQYGFHGRLFGSLSATRSKAIHKIDVPAFDWPAAPFPEIKYPLEENEAHNKAEEIRCLKAYEKILIDSKSSKPVAAVIIEPILSEGGDKHASPSFFRSLRLIAKEHGAFFIVDEVQTGVGATGTFWAHEKWGLKEGEEPDFVTFSKKMQAAGVFHNLETRPNAPYRNYNTWMGDPMRAIQAKKMLEVIKSHNLVEHTKKTGELLYPRLEQLFSAHPKVHALRGKNNGTFIAWDFSTPADRDKFVTRMRANGVQMGGCGEKSVRLRPTLTFGPSHIEILLKAIEKSLSEL